MRRLVHGVVVGLSVWAAVASPVAAQQGPDALSQLRDVWPTFVMRPALETEYGRAVIQKAGGALEAGADPICRSQKAIKSDAYRALARMLFQIVHDEMTAAYREGFNPERADEEFSRLAPEIDLARVRGLLASTDQQELYAALQMRMDVLAIDRAGDTLARALVIARYRLPKALTALEDGDDTILMLNEQLLDAYGVRIDALDGDAQEAFTTIELAGRAAIAAATDREVLLRIGPSRVMLALTPHLEAHCLAPK